MIKTNKSIKSIIGNIVVVGVSIAFLSIIIIVLLYRTAAGEDLSFSEIISWPHIQESLVVFGIIGVIYFVISKAYIQGKINDKRDFKDNEK